MSVYVATPSNTDFDVFTVADMQTCKIRVSAFSSIIIETGVVNPIKIFDCAYMQSACTCFANQLEEFTEFVKWAAFVEWVELVEWEEWVR